MMQSSPPTSLAQGLPNPFLAFAHPGLRSAMEQSGGSMQLHPAFLHPFYAALPPQLSALRSGIPSPGAMAGQTEKSKSFTIDAILGGQENMLGLGERGVRDGGHSPAVGSHGQSKGLRAEDLVHLHRQHRLQASHPYLSPLSCSSSLSFRSNNIKVSDKCEKKSVSSMGGCMSGAGGEWKHQGKSKRVRTIFTPEQLERLEAEFERQQYMVGTERYYLAASLNLTEAQVKVWFQNRRIKWRKQNLEQQHARLAKLDILKGRDEEDHEEDGEEDEEEDDEEEEAGEGEEAVCDLDGDMLGNKENSILAQCNTSPELVQCQ